MRRDEVNRHCHLFAQCAEFLEYNGRKIECEGDPASEADLEPYDPKFHTPDPYYHNVKAKRTG